MSSLQISSRKNYVTYLKQLKEKCESIMERDKNDELSKEQWIEIVEYMKSQGHNGSLEAWKKLWEENTDSFTLNMHNADKIIEDELENNIEVLEEESNLFKVVDGSEALKEEIQNIEKEDMGVLLERYLQQPKPPDSDMKIKKLKRSLEQILEEIEDRNKKPTPPKTRSKNREPL
jgi:hypothetical protein